MTVHLNTIAAPVEYRLVEVIGQGQPNDAIGGVIYLENGGLGYAESTTDASGNFTLSFYVEARLRPQCVLSNQCVYGIVFGAVTQEIM